MVTESQVLDSLRSIIDPDLGQDIVSLGFIKDLKIDKGDVRFAIELTTHACPVKGRFKAQAEKAVGKLKGVKSVQVALTARDQVTAHGQSQKPAEEINTLEGVDSVVAVSACKGGVGKSTVAAHLARALQREGLAVGLLDADLYGPSFPTLFNLYHPDVAMRANKLVPVMADGLKIMSFGFLLGDSPAVLRGPLVSAYIQQLLTQTDWGKLDYLLIDMPPGTGDVQLTITQRAKLDGAVIVTTPQALSLVDVAKGIVMFEQVEVPVLGVVENMSYFVCDNCSKKHYIFGSSVQSLKDRFGLETLGEIPILPGISSYDAINSPAVFGPMRDLAANLRRAISQRRIEAAFRPAATAEDGTLQIQWPDDTQSVLDSIALRASCRCAQCIDEFTGEQILDVGSIDTNIRVEDLQPLGNYALAITWSDGHGSSIYSWDHLRSLAGK